MTPLHIATLYNFDKVVNILLENKADVNAKNCYNETPLHIAARYNFDKIINALLKHKADVNVKNCYDETPLHYAARYNHLEAVKILIEHKADIKNVSKLHQTPLLESSASSPELIDILIQNGSSIDETDGERSNILHCAAMVGNTRSVKYIIEKYGIDVNVRNRYNETPLHYAARQGYPIINDYKTILNRGISMGYYNKECLRFATEMEYLETIKELVKHGAKLNALDDNKSTPLHHASRYSLFPHNKQTIWYEIPNYLLSQGCELTATNNTGDTPLDIGYFKLINNITRHTRNLRGSLKPKYKA